MPFLSREKISLLGKFSFIALSWVWKTRGDKTRHSCHRRNDRKSDGKVDELMRRTRATSFLIHDIFGNFLMWLHMPDAFFVASNSQTSSFHLYFLPIPPCCHHQKKKLKLKLSYNICLLIDVSSHELNTEINYGKVN